MTQSNIISSISVYNYSREKLCDLYDSQNDLSGQAYGITFDTNLTDGIKSLSFSIPYKINGAQNFRWKYLKSEYQIKFVYDGKTEWFIAQKPSKHRDKNSVYGSVTCAGLESSLKTKNIYKEFDDENGIGTVSELADKILAGTGWSRGYTDTMLEADGVTEKIRSITSGNKQGALGLMTTLCNIFKCFPVYKSDTKTVELYNFNNRDQVLEGTIGVNLDSLSVNYNSTDIVTRLYVEGEYEEDGYVGIDAVNPTGLNYIFNFDYYKDIGVFTAEHEAAFHQYLTDIGAIKAQISAKTSDLIDVENALNSLIGQCELVVYYVSTGYITPRYIYGDPLDERIPLHVGDEVIVSNTNGTYRYATIETTPDALIQSGDYAVSKFVAKAAGLLGANEVQVEAKEKQIANLERKKSATTKADKIAEYNAEIAQLRTEITTIFTKEDGLYVQMDSIIRSDGLLYDLEVVNGQLDVLRVNQDDIESDFIIAMGDMLRDGYWNDKNYIAGQEAHLLADAEDRLDIYSRPDVTYSFNLVRLSEQFGVPIQDFKLNAVFRIHDEELDVHDNLFVTKITIGVDDESAGNIEVTNKDITLNANDLGALLSRMSQLSDLIEQKNTLYDRAKSIQKNGQIYTDRLNGQIDVLKTQLLSTVSNWYTDEQGNILFLSADGGSAMMLTGAGFMIANSKDENNEWVWRTFGDGNGFTADEIVAGFISAERIEAGTISTEKVEPGFGGSLVITGNPSITSLNNSIANDFIEDHPYSKGEMINKDGVFYIFTNDFEGGTFAEALPYLADTSVAAQIELMPDKIISMVESKSYSRTYIQPTDPTLDPALNVRFGDYWMRTNGTMNWGEVKMFTWQAIKTNKWGELKGYEELYCWNGNEWIQVSEHAAVASAFTRITQTQEMILQEAERAQGRFIAKTTHYQDADSIVTSAESYTDGKLTHYSTTIQTASMIQSTVSNALGAYSTTVQTQSMIDSTVSNALGNYSTTTQTESMISSMISTSLGNYSTTTQTESLISSMVTTSLGAYSTTSQTASAIALAVAGCYGVISGITIDSNGVDVTGNMYVKISGGANGYWKYDNKGLTYYNASNSPIMQFGSYAVRDTSVLGGVYTTNNLQWTGWTSAQNAVLLCVNSSYNQSRKVAFTFDNDGDSSDFATFAPTTNNNINFGTDDYRWTNGYFKQVNITNATTTSAGVALGGALYAYGINNIYGTLSVYANGGSIVLDAPNDGTEIKLSGIINTYPQYSTPFRIYGSLYVRDNAQLNAVTYNTLTQNSSRDIKHSIQPMQSYGEIIDRLQPVTFVYDDDPNENTRVGFIYEDTVDVLPEICTKDESNKAISYVEIIPILVKEIQELRQRVADLERS